MIVILYNTSTGEPVSIGSTAPDNVLEGYTVFTLDVPYETVGNYVWDSQTRTLTTRTLGSPVISRQTFMDRLGETVVAAIVAASKQSVEIEAWLLRYKVVPDINVTDPRTIAGVDALIGAGLIPANLRDSILAWETQ